MNKLYVNTSKGKVCHGTLHGGIFTRIVYSSAIRNTDKTLPLNPQVVGILKINNCHTLKYKVSFHPGGNNIFEVEYTIPFQKALNNPRITNEHGDTDIRIPIKDFKSETSNSFFVRQEEIKSEHQLCFEL